MNIYVYINGLVLAPKAIPINNWQRLARFCNFGGNHITSNINSADKASSSSYNAAYKSKPCFVLVRGSRVLKIHTDVESKVVALFPQHRFIGSALLYVYMYVHKIWNDICMYVCMCI